MASNRGVKQRQVASNGVILSVTRADVDLSRLKANAGVFVAACPPGVGIMAVVKANAYGHGAVECTRALASTGIRSFAVATLAEAEQLRRAGIDEQVLVFAPPLPDQFGRYEQLDVDLNLATIESVRLIASSFPDLLSRCHLKIDTGMSRVGLQPDEASEAAALIRHRGVRLKAAWTHLAHSADKADVRSNAQVSLFKSVMSDSGLSGLATHVLNTGGFIHHPELRATGDPNEDGWSRIGIGLYGIQSTQAGIASNLQPVMTVVSRILQVKRVGPGTGVSYGHTWRATVPTRVATVGAGYADGIPRALSNRGWVSVPGSEGRYPVIGRVCMDMFMIDIGPDEASCPASTGDEVVLMGGSGPSLDQVAEWANTISYEISTGISGRVPRRYVAV